MNSDAAREALLTNRADAVERLRGLDETFVDMVESARDSNLDDEHDTEGATIAASRAQVSSLAAEGRERLAEIDQALARVDDGTYGRCVRCGGLIEDGRLEARPATTSCISCAREQSRR